MKRTTILLLLGATLVSTVFAGEGPVPKGVPHLDHVFVILMENHSCSQIVNNPDAPFAWRHGHNAIITVWDENDSSLYPDDNQVLAVVDTNFGPRGLKSDKFYTHFSLPRTLEGALGLPCLNHTSDDGVKVMTDLLKGRDDE
jgi:hypothetical protein